MVVSGEVGWPRLKRLSLRVADVMCFALLLSTLVKERSEIATLTSLSLFRLVCWPVRQRFVSSHRF